MDGRTSLGDRGGQRPCLLLVFDDARQIAKS